MLFYSPSCRSSVYPFFSVHAVTVLSQRKTKFCDRDGSLFSPRLFILRLSFVPHVFRKSISHTMTPMVSIKLVIFITLFGTSIGISRKERPRLLRVRQKIENEGARTSNHDVLETSIFSEVEEDLFWNRELELVSSSMTADPATSAPTSSCTTPPPFDSDDTKAIHVVMSVDTGEFFDLLRIGMIQQVLKVRNTELVFSVSDGDDRKQGELVAAAIVQNATGIITVDGHSDEMCDAIREAYKNGIPVVSFDFDAACTDQHILTSQLDSDIARLVLDQAAADFGEEVRVGEVNDLRYQPLLNRHMVWETFQNVYGWTQNLVVENATDYSSEEALQTAIMEAIEKEESQGVSFIYAPWDYLAINSLVAIEKTSSKMWLYGADINDQDIAAMTNPPGSAWKATAGGHPSMIGAAIIRMSLLQITNEIGNVESIKLPSFLFTQDMMLKEGVTSLADLVAVMPELRLDNIAQACWIEPIDT